MVEPHTSAPPPNRRSVKSAAAFRTISEVSDDLDVPPHVLRFWETKFNQVRPLKRGGGRRYYRPEDVALLQRIRELLYREGYTIKGVQKLLREGAVRMPTAGETARAAQATNPVKGGHNGSSESEQQVDAGEAAVDRDALRSVLSELEALKRTLSEGRS